MYPIQLCGDSRLPRAFCQETTEVESWVSEEDAAGKTDEFLEDQERNRISRIHENRLAQLRHLAWVVKFVGDETGSSAVAVFVVVVVVGVVVAQEGANCPMGLPMAAV